MYKIHILPKQIIAEHLVRVNTATRGLDDELKYIVDDLTGHLIDC